MDINITIFICVVLCFYLIFIGVVKLNFRHSHINYPTYSKTHSCCLSFMFVKLDEKISTIVLI